MRPHNVRATTAGVLFITSTVTSLAATALFGSLLDGAGFLSGVAEHQDRLLVGALFQLIAAFTAASIAIALYPVLRDHAAGMALGSVGFRLIEGVFYTVSAVGTLVLVTLSDQVTGRGVIDASVNVSAGLVRDLRDSAAVVAVLAFYTGATLYYLVFYRTQLIPRWLSAWGLAGTALGATAALLILFRVTETLSSVQVAMNIPIGLQEIVFAIWLILKGFRPLPAPGDTPAGASEPRVNAVS